MVFARKNFSFFVQQNSMCFSYYIIKTFNIVFYGTPKLSDYSARLYEMYTCLYMIGVVYYIVRICYYIMHVLHYMMRQCHYIMHVLHYMMCQYRYIMYVLHYMMR